MFSSHAEMQIVRVMHLLQPFTLGEGLCQTKQTNKAPLQPRETQGPHVEHIRVYFIY